MAEALDHVLETDEARAREAAAANRPLPPYVRTTGQVGLIVVGVWLFITPPAWLLPSVTTVPAPPTTVHILAGALVGRAQEVIAFQRERGQLPGTLAELSTGAEGIHYQLTGPTTFQLRASVGDSTLVLPVTIPQSGVPSYELQQTIGFTP